MHACPHDEHKTALCARVHALRRLMTRLSGHFRRSAEPLNDVKSVEEVANTGAGAVAAAPARWAKAALLFMGRVTLTGLPAT